MPESAPSCSSSPCSTARSRSIATPSVNEIDGHDGPFALAELGELTLVFIQRPAKAGDSPVVVFGLEGGIDDYAEALAAKGVEIVVPVSEAPDGGLSLDFVDPDRNMLSLYQPPGAARRQ